MKNATTLLLFLTSLFLACGSPSPEEKLSPEKEGDMAQFADDKEFQEAHEEPRSIALELTGERISFPTPDGKTGHAYALMADSHSNDYLLVIHEWWGLNDHIRREAQRLYEKLENTNVLALDMYDGKVADTRDNASAYMQAMTEERGKAIIEGALQVAGPDADIATIGWCFGGGWSLKAAIHAGKRAAGCVMYYGMPVEDKEKIAQLQTDVLGIFAKQDEWITPEVVNEFQAKASEVGVEVTVHQFDADHAFANPSGERYNEEAAQRANKLAVSYLRERL